MVPTRAPICQDCLRGVERPDPWMCQTQIQTRGAYWALQTLMKDCEAHPPIISEELIHMRQKVLRFLIAS